MNAQLPAVNNLYVMYVPDPIVSMKRAENSFNISLWCAAVEIIRGCWELESQGIMWYPITRN